MIRSRRHFSIDEPRCISLIGHRFPAIRSLREAVLAIALLSLASNAGAESYRTNLKESAKTRLDRYEAKIEQLNVGQETCWLGVISTWNNVVTVLAEPGIQNGLQLGDRPVKVNDVDVSEQFRADYLSTHEPGDSLRMLVERGDENVELTVSCYNGTARDSAYIMMYRAAAAGDWQGCIDHSFDVDSHNEGPTSLAVNYRRRCSEAIRCSPFSCRKPTEKSAELLYQTMSLRLPAIVIAEDLESQKKYFEEAVQWLEENEFGDYALRLNREFVSADDGVAEEPKKAEATP